MRKQLLFICLGLLLHFAPKAQSGCGSGRYATEVFASHTLSSNITYGANTSQGGANTVLKLDFYEPQGDVLAKRPLVVLAHGGNFIGGDKAGADVAPVAEGLARAGCTVASINYRVGVAGIPFPGPTDKDIQEAVLRAVHDMKAAVRFFYQDAATANDYGIDTNLIFVAGASAGAVTALHYAYLDDIAEVPAAVDTNQAGLHGGLAGLSGNPGYSDRIAGVLNMSGALDEATWIVQGDEPLVSTHARADDVVPYGTGQITFLGIFQLMFVDGSATIDQRCQTLGINSCLYTHEGASVAHVPHAGSAPYLDTTMVVLRNFLSEIICGTPSTNCAYSVGVRDPRPSFEVNVIPNPSASDFAIEISNPAAEGWRMDLTDLHGRTVKTQASNDLARMRVARNGLAPGIYLMRVHNGAETLTRKIILQ